MLWLSNYGLIVILKSLLIIFFFECLIDVLGIYYKSFLNFGNYWFMGVLWFHYRILSFYYMELLFNYKRRILSSINHKIINFLNFLWEERSRKVFSLNFIFYIYLIILFLIMNRIFVQHLFLEVDFKLNLFSSHKSL